MAEFFKTSTTWVVDFRYEGRARRWFAAFGPDDDVRRAMATTLAELYGKRAQLVEVRKATAEEELQYLRGEEPKNEPVKLPRTGPVLQSMLEAAGPRFLPQGLSGSCPQVGED